MKASVSIVQCNSYDSALVFEAVKKSVGLLGGISAFVQPHSRVLVKPNLLMAKEPEYGIVTHPEVVRAVIKLLKEIDCTIIVGDGPSVWGSQIENAPEVYERSGMRKLCLEEDVTLVPFDKRRWRGKFPLTTELDNCDHLVNIPKFKTHEFTILSAAIKNLFGLVCGTFKTELHKQYFRPEDFAKILVDIYQEARPSLTVVDGIVAMHGDGPATGGKLRKTNLLLAGADGVAIDAVLAMIMGISPTDVITTKEAAARGLGVCDINSITVLGEKLQEVIKEPFLLPTASKLRKIPAPIMKVARRLIKYYPYGLYANCIRCGRCIQICPHKVISMQKNGIEFDYKRCIACFCCQEICPASAIKIRRSLFAKLIGL